MSEKKSGKSRRGGRASDFAKNIWLAGLGAYGKTYDDLANQQQSLKDLPQLFKDLVAKGAGIESSRSPSDQEPPSEVNQGVEREEKPLWGGEPMEQRIRRMRDNLNLNWPSPPAQEIKELSKKIGVMETELKEVKELLAQQITAAKKKSRKKSTP